MNLVLVTSVINCNKGSVFTDEERLEQLLTLTIPSIRNKISNCFIVILEGSSLTEEHKTILENNCNQLFLFNIINLEKSLGELSLIYEYLNSNSYLELPFNIESIIKLSGRYYFLDSFNFFEYEKSVIKNIKSSWTDYYVSVTLYYKIVNSDINYFIQKIKDLILNHGIFIDIEHTYYKHNIVPCPYNIDKLGVGGCLAPSGQYIEDGIELK